MALKTHGKFLCTAQECPKISSGSSGRGGRDEIFPDRQGAQIDSACYDNVAVPYGKSSDRIQAAAVVARNLGATTSRSAYPSWGRSRDQMDWRGLESLKLTFIDATIHL